MGAAKKKKNRAEEDDCKHEITATEWSEITQTALTADITAIVDLCRR